MEPPLKRRGRPGEKAAPNQALRLPDATTSEPQIKRLIFWRRYQDLNSPAVKNATRVVNSGRRAQ